MITNHICTVIRTDEADGSRTVVGRYPCMWQETEEYEAADFGQKRTSESHIYIPDITADVREGDYVTKKIVNGSAAEVSDMLSAVAVARYDYGSKNMQHIKVAAKP
ncbi:MAG: hypothetical protein K1W17_02500 [Oscillospiraceae bacterium]